MALENDDGLMQIWHDCSTQLSPLNRIEPSVFSLQLFPYLYIHTLGSGVQKSSKQTLDLRIEWRGGRL
jgi:hypothetical protein